MRSWLSSLVVPLAAVAVAVALRLLLDPLLHDTLPFITLFLAISIAAWYGGTRSGLVAVVAGGVAAWFFFLQPRGSFAFAGVADRSAIVLYIVIGIANTALFSSLRSARMAADTQRVQLEGEVAKRRATELELVAQAELLRTTLASIADAVITTDTDARITSMNAVAESLTGSNAAEASGAHIERVFHIVDANTRDPVETPVTRTLTLRETSGIASHAILIAHDGTEHHVNGTCAPIRGMGATVMGCVLVFRDVSERARFEAELARGEQQFRALADAIPQMAWMTRANGEGFWYNQRWYDYTGTTLEQAAGWNWRCVLHPDHATEVIERWNASIASGTAFDMTFPLKGRDGQFRWFLTRIEPVKDATGRLLRWFGTNTDVSELRLREDALQRATAELSTADSRKDEFLATLAHELRNPLAPIRHGLEVMKLAHGQQSVIERTRDMMERQVTQLVHLVDDLMDVSRISRGQVTLRRQRISLSDALNSAVETSRTLMDQMGDELTVTMPEQHLHVDADLTRLSQVFQNLLNNAAKYGERGGRISVDVTCDGRDAVVSVKDNGIGIAADQLPRIFEMFTQVQDSLHKAQGGLGIGLMLVKRLAEMHGGSIEARSDGLGKGSEFIVRLPLADEAPVHRTQNGEAGLVPANSLRILIVDDNRDGADSLAMMLQMAGNEVRAVYDGQDGVDEADRFRPDVIVLDIGLPRLNGYDVCRRIREQAWGTRVVLIAVTGWGQDDDRRRAYEVGFDHHVVKPMDAGVLMQLIAGVKTAALPLRVVTDTSDPVGR